MPSAAVTVTTTLENSTVIGGVQSGWNVAVRSLEKSAFPFCTGTSSVDEMLCLFEAFGLLHDRKRGDRSDTEKNGVALHTRGPPFPSFSSLQADGPPIDHRDGRPACEEAVCAVFAYALDLGNRLGQTAEASTCRVRRPTIGVGVGVSALERILITDCGPILIVDEDEESRAFASRLFERAGFDTEQAVNGDEAMTLVRRVRPCLVLLDVLLPDVSGFEIASELRDEFGDDLPIVFISGERTQPLDRAAGLLVGGDDYVVKPADPDELLARARRLISRSRRGKAVTWPRGAVDAELTGREREVLELLANGTRPKQIARELVISPKTVASHLQSVLAKLGVHSRAEAIAIACREGFVGPVVAGDARFREG